MSHVTTIDLEVRDLDALDAACKRCGLELVRGQDTYKWFGEFIGDAPLPEGFSEEELGKCDHAIRVIDDEGKLTDTYEIGVVRRRDGRPGYQFMLDEWGDGYGLIERCGSRCEKLKQAYAIEVAKSEAQRQGMLVEEE